MSGVVSSGVVLRGGGFEWGWYSSRRPRVTPKRPGPRVTPKRPAPEPTTPSDPKAPSTRVRVASSSIFATPLMRNHCFPLGWYSREAVPERLRKLPTRRSPLAEFRNRYIYICKDNMTDADPVCLCVYTLSYPRAHAILKLKPMLRSHVSYPSTSVCVCVCV